MDEKLWALSVLIVFFIGLAIGAVFFGPKCTPQQNAVLNTTEIWSCSKERTDWDYFQRNFDGIHDVILHKDEPLGTVCFETGTAPNGVVVDSNGHYVRLYEKYCKIGKHPKRSCIEWINDKNVVSDVDPQYLNSFHYE